MKTQMYTKEYDTIIVDLVNAKFRVKQLKDLASEAEELLNSVFAGLHEKHFLLSDKEEGDNAN